MSDDQKPQSGGLANLLRSVEAGMQKLTGGNAASRTEPKVDEDDLASANETPPNSQSPDLPGVNGTPPDDDLLETVDEDAGGSKEGDKKPASLKERLQSLSLMQKGLLAVVFIVGVMALKNQQDSTESGPTASGETESNSVSTQPLQGQASEENGGFESSAGELSSGSLGTTGNLELQIDFGDDKALQDSPGYTPPGEEHPLLSMDDEITASPAETSASTLGGLPSELAEITPQSGFNSGAAKEASPQPVAVSMGEEPSPFESSGLPAFGEANLAGTAASAVDSSAQAPHASKPAGAVQQQAAPQIAQLEKTIKEQGEKIRKLEERLAKQPTQGAGSSKPVNATAAQTAPKVYASKPKQRARPKLCVSSVAAPARNCTTCVAHAVVTSNGAETMIGNGGSFDGFRVSIVGDTVSLQGEDGTQPHQFWPSSTGCSR